MTTDNLYPPSIQGVPPNLTAPSMAYRRQVVVVLISIVVFVMAYIGLIAGSAWLVFYGIAQATTDANQFETARSSDNNWWFGLSVIAGVLLLFLVKALFKWHKDKDKMHIEITEQEHPELFRFVRKICEDTRAPQPKKVFVTHDVNAAVFYNSSVLSLFFPVRKNLLIGLGLVNCLNLSEFKAALAHEFGHFSQSSMRLGSYVYVANHVIYDLVYRRDSLDELLEKAKRTNIRIAVFAWAIYAVLWALRMLLSGVFKLINFLESALSRQMEFHADLVAVSITGSDSLIHVLKKLEFANACLLQAYGDLQSASQHKLYSQDIYYHQTLAANYLRSANKDHELGQIPPLPADPTQKTELFTREDDDSGTDHMWASHPSNFDREQNAKRVYLRSIDDDRSPWLLFSRPDDLRRRMTETFYRNVLDLKALTTVPADQVQKFIDDEHAETTQDERYKGFYDGRMLSISPDELTGLAESSNSAEITPVQIMASLNKLYNAEYEEWMVEHRKRQEESALLEAVDSGQASLKGSTFEFRNELQPKSRAKPLIEMVDSELKADADWLKAFDGEVLVSHLWMARAVGEDEQDLLLRYEFQLKLQGILRTAMIEEGRLGNIYRYLSGKTSSLSQGEFNEVLAGMKDAYKNVDTAYRAAQSVKLPALNNIEAGELLSDFLLGEPMVGPMPDEKKIDGIWLGALGRQVSQMETRSRRLYFKSMGAILTRQEAIAEKYNCSVNQE
jgi:Zn-dependent protease with chaperone function